MAGRFERVPGHVGVIMDGNGRWARQRGLPRIEGHRRGGERARELIRILPEYGVRAVTLYTFSLENWQRPEKEIRMLMSMLERYLRKDMNDLVKEGVRFRAIGETWRLSEGIQKLIKETEAKTSGNQKLTVVTALSYGGRNEIVRAVRKAMEKGLSPDEVTEESFGELMDTSGIPDPDLIIRTSGEIRLSNFLPWQTAYSEFYFTEKLWPEFDRAELEKALEDYQRRDRRFGALDDKEDQSA